MKPPRSDRVARVAGSGPWPRRPAGTGPHAPEPSSGGRAYAPLVRIELTVNGRRRRITVPPMTRLLDALRADLGLPGAKEGCGEGECGACTVLMDGLSVCSCLVPVVQARGAQILTVEGLARSGRLSELQQVFVEMGAAQCGICTPGMLVTSVELLARCRGRVPGEEEVREALAGNLCRCTGYQKIVDAVRETARRARGARDGAARRPNGATAARRTAGARRAKQAAR